LHHSITPFAGHFEADPRKYNSGIPMLFARAIRRFHPELEVEVWRPEHTLREEHVWHDEYGVTHRVFPSFYIRFNAELSPSLLRAVSAAVKQRRSYFWVHGIYNLHAYSLGPMLRHSPAIGQSHGGFPAKTMFKISRHQWTRALYLPLQPIERWALPKYPHIYALGSTEKEYLVEDIGMAPEQVTCSPTGIYFDQFTPGDRARARDECAIEDGARVVLYVGRLSQEKGVQFLIEAFRTLADRLPAAHLVIVGTGPLEHALKSQVDGAGLARRSRFVGYVTPDDLPSWYRAADVTVVPSLIDWFPKVAMESMACGTPIVITEGGGAIDIVREFECGLLARLGDSACFAQAIEDVLEAKVNITPNIDRGRRVFDWSVKLRQAFSLLETLR
jgi:glycosyltransferase involved in cell wall biosynthesis